MTTAAAASADPIEPPPRLLDAQNPWPGLDAFDETSTSYFNGREQERTELARLVSQAPLTVLFGKSGLGKTSLLKAGLFPLLRAQGIFPVYVRLAVLERDRPLIEQLSETMRKEAGERGVQVSPSDFSGTLWEHLHLAGFALWSATNQPLVPLFVLDQFEEVFTLGGGNPAAVERLRLDLADLAENRIPAPVVRTLEASPEEARAIDVRRQRYKVLISFREDFLPEIDGWRTILPSLVHNRCRLREMSAAQGFAAVFRTGSAARLVDAATAHEIVRFVGKIQTDDRNAVATTRSQQPATDADLDEFARHEIEPALLSLVCAELNKRRQAASPPAPTIDADLLRGTAASIIQDFYLRQMTAVPAPTRQFIEDELLTEGGYRSSFPVAEALKQGVLNDALLRGLVDGRLLRIEHQLGVPRVELTHDRLTDVVRLEREKRRSHERTTGRRRTFRIYGSVSAVVAVLALFGAFSWVARVSSENQRIEAEAQRRVAERERDEATKQRALAVGARLQAEEARLQAEKAQRIAVEAQAKAEEQRALAEERQQRVLDERQRAREADSRAEAAAAREQDAANDARRQNALVGELYAPVRPGVLQLEIDGSVRATGFFVSRSGFAVTPGHVVAGAENRTFQARNFDGRQYNVRVVRRDAARDLALLQVEVAGNAPCLQFTAAGVAVGTPVAALSIAPPQGWIATSGRILRLNVSLGRSLVGPNNQRFMDGDLIETDLDAEGGFSGSPVMDPYARRVVGIGAYGNRQPTPRHYLIPASRIREAFAAELGGGACSDSETR